MDCKRPFQDADPLYGPIVAWDDQEQSHSQSLQLDLNTGSIELGTSASELTIHSPNLYSPGVVNDLESTTPTDLSDTLEFPVGEVKEGDGVITVRFLARV
jgi:hypothetical protein